MRFSLACVSTAPMEVSTPNGRLRRIIFSSRSAKMTKWTGSEREAPDHAAAEAPHETLSARPARHHADARLRKAELGPLLADPEVCRRGELEPAAKGVAVQGR